MVGCRKNRWYDQCIFILKNFSKNIAVGVEPCKNLARLTVKKKYKTFSEYWNLKLAKKITKVKKADLVYSANTLSHIKKLDEIFNAINYSLSRNEILILEDPSGWWMALL